jgi:hypothetical protein
MSTSVLSEVPRERCVVVIEPCPAMRRRTWIGTPASPSVVEYADTVRGRPSVRSMNA